MYFVVEAFPMKYNRNLAPTQNNVNEPLSVKFMLALTETRNSEIVVFKFSNSTAT